MAHLQLHKSAARAPFSRPKADFNAHASSRSLLRPLPASGNEQPSAAGLNEDTLQRLRAAEEEAAKLKAELARLQQVRRALGSRGARVGEGPDNRRQSCVVAGRPRPYRPGGSPGSSQRPRSSPSALWHAP